MGRGYEWTKTQSMPHIPGLKLHLLYAPQAHLPCDAKVTASRVSDLSFGRDTELETGAIYLFDKGYCDYNWWYRIDQADAYFVTRLKKNAKIGTLETRPISANETTNIVADDVIELQSIINVAIMSTPALVLMDSGFRRNDG